MSAPLQHAQLTVWVHYHQYYLMDPDDDDPLRQLRSAYSNGLVEVVPGAAAITTGLHTGDIALTVETWDEPPPLVLDTWDEVIEISLSWPGLHATVADGQQTPLDDLPDIPDLAVAGTSSYRLRVHARGRDEGQAVDTLEDEQQPIEEHLIQVWPAPLAPETTHKATDSVGAYWRAQAGNTAK